MNIIDPIATIDPASWADPTTTNIVKNGDPASGLYVASADTAGAYCLYAGYPHTSVSFPSLPTTASYATIRVMAPPFTTKAQIGAVAYLNNPITAEEIPSVTVVNATGGASGTTTYLINLEVTDLSDIGAEVQVQKWQIGWGGASDTGQLMDIAEGSDLGIPAVQELRLNVSHSQVVCTGLIIRWTRDTNTLS